MTTIFFEALNDEDVIDKECLQTKLAEVKDHITYIEKDYNAIKDHERYK